MNFLTASCTVLTVLALGACSTTPPPATAQAPAGAGGARAALAASPSRAPAAPAPVAAADTTARDLAASRPAPPAYLDPASPIASQRSVYFDFDVYTVRPGDEALLAQHGKYLAGSPSVAIKVEGNADERGSAEYNLALGQKRAESVVRVLRLHGVKDTQMEAVSWGKTQPRNPGHDEAAWAENRRADLVYPKQ